MCVTTTVFSVGCSCGSSCSRTVGHLFGAQNFVARFGLVAMETCSHDTSILFLTEGVFFSMKQVGDFIIDVLVGSVHPEVRTASCVLFNKLCQKVPAVSDTMATDDSPQKKC